MAELHSVSRGRRGFCKVYSRDVRVIGHGAVGEMSVPMWGGSRAGAGCRWRTPAGLVDSRGCGCGTGRMRARATSEADSRRERFWRQRGVQAYQTTPATMIEKSTPARNFHMVLSPLALTAWALAAGRRGACPAAGGGARCPAVCIVPCGGGGFEVRHRRFPKRRWRRAKGPPCTSGRRSPRDRTGWGESLRAVI